jgi:hypothetical protein
MPPSEEAIPIRRAGTLVALAAAAVLVLVLFPAPAALEPRYVVLVLGLFVAFLFGSAAVLLSPAHRADAHLAQRDAEAAGELRWVGFTGIAFYAAYVVGLSHARNQPPVAAASVDKVNGFILFMVFLAGVWTLNMSVVTVTGRGSPPPPAAAVAEEELGGGEVDAMIP